jgi:hypothetical protein
VNSKYETFNLDTTEKIKAEILWEKTYVSAGYYIIHRVSVYHSNKSDNYGDTKSYYHEFRFYYLKNYNTFYNENNNYKQER